jgi:hypothetical protein
LKQSWLGVLINWVFILIFFNFKVLGQKRKDATKEQIQESQDVVSKLNSTIKTKVEKRFIMNKVFGDYRKVKLKILTISS